jgi:N-acetylglutamate synthase-like GNAT family acetyltransferase
MQTEAGILSAQLVLFYRNEDPSVYIVVILIDRTFIEMREYQIDYLVEYPHYIPQLARWLFEQWGSILGEKTLETRIKKLRGHMNRDQLPIAWVAHANGQLLGTAALRVHDLEGREDLTPWLGGVYVGSQFRRRGIGEVLCATVEEAARSRGIQTLYLFTLDKQAWYSGQGWSVLASCVWHERPGDIMSKTLQPA